MPTINSREIVDEIIAGNGIYPGDEHIRCLKIVQYNNQFNGNLAYGLVYEGDYFYKYEESSACHNPKVIFEYLNVNKKERG